MVAWLAKGLAGAEEVPGMVGLVVGQVGSGGISLEQPQRSVAWLGKGRAWWAKAHVGRARHLRRGQPAAHQSAGAVVLEHGLPGKQRRVRVVSHEEGFSVLWAWRRMAPVGLHVMRGPRGLTKTARHVWLEVSLSWEPRRTHSRSRLALSRRHQGHLHRCGRAPEVRVDVDVFGLGGQRWVGVLGKPRWGCAHHPWWRRLSVDHVWGHERLQGLLDQGPPRLREERGASQSRVMLRVGGHSRSRVLHVHVSHERISVVIHSPPVSPHVVRQKACHASSSSASSSSSPPAITPLSFFLLLFLELSKIRFGLF